MPRALCQTALRSGLRERTFLLQDHCLRMISYSKPIVPKLLGLELCIQMPSYCGPSASLSSGVLPL
jgi:hypothetical protein